MNVKTLLLYVIRVLLVLTTLGAMSVLVMKATLGMEHCALVSNGGPLKLPTLCFTILPCADINECAESTAACDSNATCANSPGSYECICDNGYSGDGMSCTGMHPLTVLNLSFFILNADIDECQAGTNSCDENAACSNTVGSYICSCLFGYSGDGMTCTGRGFGA